ncbi:MAG: butyrate kinase [bacterium]
MASQLIFVINPGSTSTKLAFFSEKKSVWEHMAEHPRGIGQHPRDVLDERTAEIENLLGEKLADWKPHAVVGRGGPLRPLEGGTYFVNDKMINELFSEQWSAHASNLGAPLARHFAHKWDVPAYVVDPVTVDNFTPLARISGVPEIKRRCRSHALNIRSCAHLAAAKIGKPLQRTRFVVAHLGGGISVATVEGGRITDVNDALLGMGPFSPTRAGAVPIGALVEIAMSGKYTKEQLLHKLSHESGFAGYLDTNSLVRVEELIEEGDENARLIRDAMVYQIAKEIGACVAVLKGKDDAVILTGGLVHSHSFRRELRSYIRWVGRILIFPGEREMEALAAGAFRVLKGEEEAKEY